VAAKKGMKKLESAKKPKNFLKSYLITKKLKIFIFKVKNIFFKMIFNITRQLGGAPSNSRPWPQKITFPGDSNAGFIRIMDSIVTSWSANSNHSKKEGHK
jgi:hypothetical protein